MKFEYILPIITLLIGWLLNEIAGYFKIRRESKQAISRAIADLLDVHDELSIYRRTLASVQSHLRIPTTELFPLRQALVQQFLSSNISSRYEEAVTIIASNDPLLGFKLRSKASVNRTLDNLGSLFPPNSKVDSAFFEMEAKLVDAAIASLKESIIDLSKRYKWITWYRVRKYLAQERSISSGSKEVLRIMSDAIHNLEKPSPQKKADGASNDSASRKRSGKQDRIP